MWAWPASHTFERIVLDEGAGDAGGEGRALVGMPGGLRRNGVAVSEGT